MTRDLREYAVTVKVIGTYDIMVKAKSAAHARELVEDHKLEGADFSDISFSSQKTVGVRYADD